MDGMHPDFLYTTEEEKTFQYQDSLPSLPLPPLEQTLRKYLDSGELPDQSLYIPSFFPLIKNICKGIKISQCFCSEGNIFSVGCYPLQFSKNPGKICQ